jgi:L-lactate dehydrogenase complex protein LldG
MSSGEAMIDCVRRALGRTGPACSPPVPPVIEEPITRLVHSEIGLPELFTRMAQQNQVQVNPVRVDELTVKLIEFLRAEKCFRVAVSSSGVVERLGIREALLEAGLNARDWDQMTLDELYDCDAGITDVYAAVAEVGGLVIRGTDRHGRAISLVPRVHVAILEPKLLVPDLVDLFEKLSREPEPFNSVIITGPSKTGDIEMILVTGVHGPGIVKVLLLG